MYKEARQSTSYNQMRYFLEVSYIGTRYHGWQVQNNAHTLQQELENALKLYFRKRIATFASGRTDTGVHAEQQFVQVDVEKEFCKTDLFRLNKILPSDIFIKNYYPVTDTATARFDAYGRTYEYRISFTKSPFLNGLVYEFPKELNVEAMNAAAALLMNHTDFQSFSKVHTDVESFECWMYQAAWTRKDNLLVFTIEANRFLRGMVRAIVGTMILVGLGKISVEEFNDIILKKDRKAAGQAAPAEGLFLCKVKYPEEIFLELRP